MSRNVLVAGAAVSLVVLLAGVSQSQDPTKKLTVRWIDGPPAAESVKLRRELTAKKRMELGLSLASVRDAVKNLRQSGEIDDRSSTSEIAAAVLAQMEARDPKSFAAPGLDLDAILEWIERVVPLILKLLALFSSPSA